MYKINLYKEMKYRIIAMVCAHAKLLKWKSCMKVRQIQECLNASVLEQCRF